MVQKLRGVAYILILKVRIQWLDPHFVAELHQLLGADRAIWPEIGASHRSAEIVASVTHEFAHVSRKIPFARRHVHHPGHCWRSANNGHIRRKFLCSNETQLNKC